VLTKDVGVRTREIISQACDKNGIQIIKGRVSKDHVHLSISYPPKLSVSEMVRVTEEMIREYLDHHDKHPNHNDNEFRVE